MNTRRCPLCRLLRREPDPPPRPLPAVFTPEALLEATALVGGAAYGVDVPQPSPDVPAVDVPQPSPGSPWRHSSTRSPTTGAPGTWPCSRRRPPPYGKEKPVDEQQHPELIVEAELWNGRKVAPHGRKDWAHAAEWLASADFYLLNARTPVKSVTIRHTGPPPGADLLGSRPLRKDIP